MNTYSKFAPNVFLAKSEDRYSKATSILKAAPESLAQAILAIKKNRETGYLSL